MYKALLLWQYFWALSSVLQILHVLLRDKQYFYRSWAQALFHEVSLRAVTKQAVVALMCALGYPRSSARFSQMVMSIENLILQILMFLKVYAGTIILI